MLKIVGLAIQHGHMKSSEWTCTRLQDFLYSIGIQHTANHGAIDKDTKLEFLLGMLNDVAVGVFQDCLTLQPDP